MYLGSIYFAFSMGKTVGLGWCGPNFPASYTKRQQLHGGGIVYCRRILNVEPAAIRCHFLLARGPVPRRSLLRGPLAPLAWVT